MASADHEKWVSGQMGTSDGETAYYVRTEAQGAMEAMVSGPDVCLCLDETMARRIAALPQLLAALRRLLATVNPGNAAEHDDGCRCVIHEAHAAIAKASA